MLELPPKGSPERAVFQDRMLNDTGFMCRNVLGMDTDHDPTTAVVSDEGQGGIRSYGPHQIATAFMDDQHVERCVGVDGRLAPLDRDVQYRVVCLPRFTYKSSRALGLIVRLLLRWPNISIMSCMATKTDAKSRVLKVREILETNPIITELFGDVSGSHWEQGSFITSLRTSKTTLSPSLWAASPDIGLAGHRPDFVLLDDVSNEKTSTDAMKAKVVRFLQSVIALQGRSTKFLMLCTPWYDGDGYSWTQKSKWNTLNNLDAGVDLVRDEAGMPFVKLPEGKTEARWPNLTVEFLQRYLDGGVTPEFFTAQFLLRSISSIDPHFKKAQFQPIAWNGTFGDLSGFQLVDVAPSGNPDGDQNVILYVGMDERFLYLLDGEVGYWKQAEFCERHVAMLARWQGRVRHQGEVWEKGQTYYGYTEEIARLCRQRGVRHHILKAVTRNATSQSKIARILGLPVRFQTYRVKVVDTMPRTWNNGTEHKPFWVSDGEIDPITKMRLPEGELVDQFVRFPHHSKRDIPDCLSLVDAMDETNNRRVCFHVPPAATQVPQEQMSPTEADEPLLRLGSYSRFVARFRNR